MSEDVFKAPKAKRSHQRTQSMNWSPSPKKRRTKDDFFSFCNIVLAYTQYESLRQEDLRVKNNTSPLDSSGSTADSFSSESTSSTISASEDSLNKSEFDSAEFEGGEFESGGFESGFSGDEELFGGQDKDSWDLITCYCMKPFAGRPMIECSECDTWIHLSCAKIRKSNIPEEFVCQKCRDSKLTTRKSTRIRSEKKHLNV